MVIDKKCKILKNQQQFSNAFLRIKTVRFFCIFALVWKILIQYTSNRMPDQWIYQ